MHAGAVWQQRHLGIIVTFCEGFLSFWNTDCDDLFSTYQFPTVWREWLKEQLTWGKSLFWQYLLTSVLQLHVLIDKKQGKEAAVKGEREIKSVCWGKEGEKLLAYHLSFSLCVKQCKMSNFLWFFFFFFKHSLITERFRRKCKWLQCAIALKQGTAWISGVLCEGEVRNGRAVINKCSGSAQQQQSVSVFGLTRFLCFVEAFLVQSWNSSALYTLEIHPLKPVRLPGGVFYSMHCLIAYVNLKLKRQLIFFKHHLGNLYFQ